MNTIILYQPQIPQNTGNIVRTCHATGSNLVLVRPLGFKTDDKSLKRAGLDYWEGVKITLIDDLMGHLEKETRPFYFFSSQATAIYTQASFENGVVLIFGSESAGLPDQFVNRWPEKFLTLPMQRGSRCLNLSNAAAIALYEVLRQSHFTSLKT
ncbi:MAG: tRNA (cytidine(34)-2'-O)-methyltransferase [Simkaniaceae bacterium]|nr:tRNA (cytidine(34)-2'-O)-methyltransferase [Simkaniaceae bacterium]